MPVGAFITVDERVWPHATLTTKAGYRLQYEVSRFGNPSNQLLALFDSRVTCLPDFFLFASSVPLLPSDCLSLLVV